MLREARAGDPGAVPLLPKFDDLQVWPVDILLMAISARESRRLCLSKTTSTEATCYYAFFVDF